jgi:4-hydroxy-tetrahydrodipicolinate synthase
MPARPKPSLSGIWAAITTPFQTDGTLDPNGIAANARHYRDALGLDGVFCHGIMGEGWSLTLDERKAALEALIDGGGGQGGLPVGVVVTHHALAETQALAHHAGASGAHHVVLMRPRGPYRDAELIACAEAAVDAAGLPLVLFESSAPGMGFGPTVIKALAERGLVLGIKATGGAKAVSTLRSMVGESCTVCDPHEDQWLRDLLSEPSLPLYADPEPYLYQTAPRQAIRSYRDALTAGNTDTALAYWRQLEPWRRIYHRWIIGPLDRGHSPAAALKHWMQRLGLAAGPVRAPLLPLSPDDARALDADLAALPPLA